MGNIRHKKAKGLVARRSAYDSLPSYKKDGRKRPGSMSGRK
jgi:hypothetical protein